MIGRGAMCCGVAGTGALGMAHAMPTGCKARFETEIISTHPLWMSTSGYCNLVLHSPLLGFIFTFFPSQVFDPSLTLLLGWSSASSHLLGSFQYRTRACSRTSAVSNCGRDGRSDRVHTRMYGGRYLRRDVVGGRRRYSCSDWPRHRRRLGSRADC